MPNPFAVAGANSKYAEPGAEPAGFFAGWWHGLIAPITVWISMFADGVSVFEQHNTGRWYGVGFILGVAASFGGGGSRVSHSTSSAG